MKYLAKPSYQYQVRSVWRVACAPAPLMCVLRQDGEVNPREANEERAKDAESQLYYSRKARPVDYKCVCSTRGGRGAGSILMCARARYVLLVPQAAYSHGVQAATAAEVCPTRHPRRRPQFR